MTAIGARTATNALVLLLGAAVFLNYVDRGAIGIAAPLMKSELGLSATAFGVASSRPSSGFTAPVQFVRRLAVRPLLRLPADGRGHAALGGRDVPDGLCRRLRVAAGPARDARGRREHRVSREARRSLPAGPGRAAGHRQCSRVHRHRPGPRGRHAGGRPDPRVATAGRAIFLVFGIADPDLAVAVAAGHVAACEPARAGPARPARAGWRNHRPLAACGRCRSPTSPAITASISCSIWLPIYLVKSRGLSLIEMTWLATLGYVAQAAAAIGFGLWSDRWTRSGRSEAAIRRWMMVGRQIV